MQRLALFLVAMLAVAALAQEQQQQQEVPPQAAEQAVEQATVIPPNYDNAQGQVQVQEPEADVGHAQPQMQHLDPQAMAEAGGEEFQGEGEAIPDQGEGSYEDEEAGADDETEQFQSPGCLVNPINNQLCGGPSQGYCYEPKEEGPDANAEAKVCICHEVDDKTGWFGDACQCSFNRDGCNPQHCYWCAQVNECVLTERDCGELIREGPEEEGGEDDESQSEYEDEQSEGRYDRADNAINIVPKSDESWAGGSTSTLMFFLVLIGATGIAFYFIRAKGMSRARREYGALRGDEL